jgi:CRISPR/Cas system endoribonuclease Cas6 (RAMP superfamily)
MAKKFVLLGNFSNEEIVKVMQKIKEAIDTKEVIFATLTPTVMEWEVKDWLEELEKEDDYFKNKK